MWEYVALLILSFILTYFLSPKPNIPKIEPRDVEIPKAEEGTPIPVVFGTVWIRDPVVGWWGDVKTVAVKSKSGKK